MERAVHRVWNMASTESVIRAHSTLERSTDRRKAPRVPLGRPALVDAQTSWARAVVEDISEGGVAIRCESAFPVGRRVEVYFELPTGVAVEASARVVRSVAQQLALAFEQLDSRAALALRVHCQRRALQ